MAYYDIKEINEAIDAGEEAYRCLCRAEDHLSSARGWGIFDMLGGGLISSLIKHSKLRDAESELQQAAEALRCFSNELRDVNMTINTGVSFDGFVEAIDIFCDGFLVDAIVQSKIAKSREMVDEAKLNVKEALIRLRAMR